MTFDTTKNYSSAYGGHIVDYPDFEKTLQTIIDPTYKVQIDINYSIYEAIGGSHFYPDIHKEGISFFDIKDDCWRTCWDYPEKYKAHYYDCWDDACKGIPYEVNKDGKFETFDAMCKWIEQVVAKLFSSDQYNVNYNFKRKRLSIKDRQAWISGD